jgi:predicted nucleic acid-binding Zn ribbon protein
MPVYECECPICGTQDEYFASVDDRNKLVPQCCGKQMNRLISGCMGFVQKDIAYESPTTGKVVTSHKARKDDLKRSRARPWEGMEVEKQEAARKRAYQDQKHDAKLEDASRRAFHQLSPTKRRILEKA